VLPVVRILAPNPSVFTLEGTNTWVVGAAPALVIDPGPDEALHLREIVRTAGEVAVILITHDHPDHAPGADSLAALTGAPVLAFRLPGAERLRDGQAVRGGGVMLTAIHAPGHTSDHLVFHEPSTRSLFTGDAVVGRGTSFIDPPDGDLAAYLRSLRRMQDLHPKVIYPGHGPIVVDAAGKLEEYVEHRRDREEQVLSAIADGRVTVPAMVERIYADYPKEVLPLAARSVTAHLIKLEAEGRLERSGHGDDARYVIAEPRSCARCGRSVRGRARLCGSCSLAVLQGGD
jgi:glyoxylase-like metal-dependent hydrolase (beta-lactamase superfamily II)